MAIQNGAFTRTNSFGPGEERIYPRFYVDSVTDQVATEREGRLICRDEERVELIIPGNPHTKPVFRVSQEHTQRWPKEYEAFKAGMTISAEGTPLEEWPRLKRGQVLEMKHLGFRTVEDIAKMGDLEVQRIGMGGMELRNLARAFIDTAEETRLTNQLMAENTKLVNRQSELEAKVQELSSLLSQVHSEMQGMKNAPNPIAAMIPGMMDPIEQAKLNPTPQQASTSSLAEFAQAKRPPGRPRKDPV
jgi:hypothetical protein